MKGMHALLAGAAALALTAPALAQQDGQDPQAGQSAAQAQGYDGQAMHNDPQMVQQVQQKLKDQGFDVGQVDGIWGPQTAEALKEFQRQQGMEATGDLSQSTLIALGVGLDGGGATAAGQPGAAQDATGEAEGMGDGSETGR
ncbi:MAG: peptidoglycan-binding protein [Burkholderiales bacterium]|nr:peptidoglycan-binding protein [Burkholderiales bacterium]